MPQVGTVCCCTLLTHPIVNLCYVILLLQQVSLISLAFLFCLLKWPLQKLQRSSVHSTSHVGTLYSFLLLRWPLQTLQRLSIHSTSHVGTLYCYTLLTHPIVTLCWHTLLSHLLTHTIVTLCWHTLLSTFVMSYSIVTLIVTPYCNLCYVILLSQ